MQAVTLELVWSDEMLADRIEVRLELIKSKN